ncbi:MAG: ATP cone domain-containing protein, partial [Eubacterium sp.]|nr:ATP cone domain-containing protein [Eubacterium sp.]
MGLFLMNLKVKKRDGTIVPFDKEKISTAISKAYIEVCSTSFGKRHEQQINDVNEAVCDILQKTISTSEVDIEQIQDIVEQELMSVNKTVAKSYITYRYKRALARDEYRQLMAAVKEKLIAKDVKNQNANVDEHSFGGRIGEMSDLIMKRYALDYCMSDMARNNHLNNEIYTHDLSHYAVGDHNCLSVPFDDLLANGFNTRQTDVRPAQSVNTAFQLVAVIFQLQSLQQFGGVSATHLDWTMIPYVRKSFSKHFRDGIKYLLHDEEYAQNVPKELCFDDLEANCEQNKDAYKYAMDMTVKEVYQAVERMYHNLNTLQSRSGNQLP